MGCLYWGISPSQVPQSPSLLLLEVDFPKSGLDRGILSSAQEEQHKADHWSVINYFLNRKNNKEGKIDIEIGDEMKILQFGQIRLSFNI